MSLVRAICKHITRTPGGIDGLTFDPTGTDGNVFTHTMPSGPNLAVGVYAEPGAPQRTNAPTDLPSFRVQVRGDANDFYGAETLAAAVIADLTCLDGVWLDQDGDDEVWLIGCTAALSTPTPLGRDANQRFEFVTYFDARIHQPTTHRPAGV